MVEIERMIDTSFYLREQSMSRHINSENETRRDKGASRRIFRVVSWLMGKKSDMFNLFTDRWIVWHFSQFFGRRCTYHTDHLIQLATSKKALFPHPTKELTSSTYSIDHFASIGKFSHPTKELTSSTYSITLFLGKMLFLLACILVFSIFIETRCIISPLKIFPSSRLWDLL